jgi:hypothetical protein
MSSSSSIVPAASFDHASKKAATPSYLIWVVCIFTCLNLAVFLLRAVSILRFGSLFGTTGGECLMTYSIWKKMHGYPIYESPLTKPFSLSLYNYLFYYVYAEVFRALGWWDAQILTFGRMLTALFAVIGALAQWQLVRMKISSRIHTYLCLGICLGLWLSTSVVRWWALTIRPDIPAVALVTLALLCLGRVSGIKGAVLAACFFYLAWSFKQSIALIAAACIVYLLATRRRSGFILLAIFGGAIAITFLLGTEAYRYSVFNAPRVVPSFTVSYAWTSLKQPLVTFSFFLVPLLLLLVRPWQRHFDFSDMLRLAALLSFVGGCIAMGKAGAGDNYLFEMFIAGTTLLLLELFRDPNRKLVLAFLLLACVQPAVQVVGNFFGRQTFGAVEIANVQDFAHAQTIQQRVMQLPGPLLTTDEVLSLPWNSTHNLYPAYVFDLVFIEGAKGHLFAGGPIGMIERGEVPTLMLKTSDAELWRSAAGKYKKTGEETHQHFHYDLFAIRADAK